jgi:hypothetical protein
MTNANALYQTLPFRGEISKVKLDKKLAELKPGAYIFVATRSRPNPKATRKGLLAFLGFRPGARWRTRSWTVLTADHMKKLPNEYETFLDRIEFQKS